MADKDWALVTGASSGLGRQFAKQLVARGLPVIAVARRKERLDALAAEAADAGGRVESVALDLTEEGAGERLFERAAELGRVDLLVNNAGFGGFGPYVDREWNEVRGMVRLNCEVLAELTWRFLPGMVERGRGGVINIASAVSFQPIPYMSTYAATKAFVLHFTEGLAEELRGTGVHVLASCPGSTRTEFQDVSGSGKAAEMGPGWMEAEDVVREALEAFDRGRVVRVHGAMNVLSAVASRRAPKSWVRRFLGTAIRRTVRGE